MKKIILLILISMSLFGWEINTHRAIDRIAIEKSQNLKYFVSNSGIPTNKNHYKNEIFEGYDTTYLTYVINPNIGEGEKSGVSKWKQTFGTKPSYQQMIEAGTILEDAMWQGASFGGNGRFNNHFYEAQNGGHELTYGYGFHVNAVKWATDSSVPTSHPNLYNYPRAMRYFALGFTESDPNVRRKYQAKMLVSVGHLMHLVNDMNVPAHVRDDAHPFGDPLEIWMRGGWDGKSTTKGFHVRGNKIIGSISKNMGAIHPQRSVAGFMTAEASFTSKNFLTQDTLYLDSNSYLPNKSTIRYSSYYNIVDGVKKRYIRNRYGTKIAMEINSHLCNNIQKIYYPNNPSRRGKGLCGAPTTLKGDYTVLAESGAVLIKRAIGNAAGFLNYFFRGQISAAVTDDKIVVRNRSNTSLVANNMATLQESGVYKLMYEESNGKRYPLKFRIDVEKLDGSIAYSGSVGDTRTFDSFPSKINVAPGRTIEVPIILDDDTRLLIRNKKVIVIYDGYIGNERGLAVCNASTPKGGFAHRE